MAERNDLPRDVKGSDNCVVPVPQRNLPLSRKKVERMGSEGPRESWIETPYPPLRKQQKIVRPGGGRDAGQTGRRYKQKTKNFFIYANLNLIFLLT